jgi:hypothetical protein
MRSRSRGRRHPRQDQMRKSPLSETVERVVSNHDPYSDASS